MRVMSTGPHMGSGIIQELINGVRFGAGMKLVMIRVTDMFIVCTCFIIPLFIALVWFFSFLITSLMYIVWNIHFFLFLSLYIFVFLNTLIWIEHAGFDSLTLSFLIRHGYKHTSSNMMLPPPCLITGTVMSGCRDIMIRHNAKTHQAKSFTRVTSDNVVTRGEEK